MICSRNGTSKRKGIRGCRRVCNDTYYLQASHQTQGLQQPSSGRIKLYPVPLLIHFKLLYNYPSCVTLVEVICRYNKFNSDNLF